MGVCGGSWDPGGTRRANACGEGGIKLEGTQLSDTSGDDV